MDIAQNIWFDESDLIAVRKEANGTICLLLEGVQIGDHVRNVAVRLVNVRHIVRDDLPVDAIEMEQDYGEVLVLERRPDFVLLVIDWKDYVRHTNVTRSYHIVCDSLRIDLI